MAVKIASRMDRMAPSGIRKVNEKALAMERNGEKVIHFEIGRPDFDTPEYIKKAAIESLNAGNVFYTSNFGTMELRQAIADQLAWEVTTLLEQAGNPAPAVERIQDMVEQVLMNHGYHAAAKRFILYRQARTDARNRSEQGTGTVVLEPWEPTLTGRRDPGSRSCVAQLHQRAESAGRRARHLRAARRKRLSARPRGNPFQDHEQDARDRHRDAEQPHRRRAVDGDPRGAGKARRRKRPSRDLRRGL